MEKITQNKPFNLINYFYFDELARISAQLVFDKYLRDGMRLDHHVLLNLMHQFDGCMLIYRDTQTLFKMLEDDLDLITDVVDRNALVCIMYNKYLGVEDLSKPKLCKFLYDYFGINNTFDFAVYPTVKNFYGFFFYYQLFVKFDKAFDIFVSLPPLAQMFSIDSEKINNATSQACDIMHDVRDTMPVVTNMVNNINEISAGMARAVPKFNETIDSVNSTIKKTKRVITKLKKTFVSDTEETSDCDSFATAKEAKTLVPRTVAELISFFFSSAEFIVSINNVCQIFKLLFDGNFNLVFKLSVIAEFGPRIIKCVYKGGDLIYSFFKCIFDFLCKNLAEANSNISLFETIYSWLNKIFRLPFNFSYVYNSISQWNTFERFGKFSLVDLLDQIRLFFAEIIPFTSISSFLDKNAVDKSVIRKFIAETVLLVHEYNDNVEQFLKSDCNYNRVNKLIDEKIVIMTTILRMKVSDLQYSPNSMRELIVQLQSIRSKFDEYRLKTFSRITPRCIRLFGESQVGKSTISNLIARHLLHLDDESLIYTRNTNDKYWSGYNNQLAVIYDDFVQNTEMSDVNELFDLITSNKVLPSMPSVDDEEIGKKGTPFNSPLVILCSNSANVGNLTNNITNVAAFYNRIHVDIKVVKKGDYTADFSHLTFHLMETATHNGNFLSCEKRVFQFKDLLEYLEDDFMMHVSREFSLKACKADYLKSVIHKYDTNDARVQALKNRKILSQMNSSDDGIRIMPIDKEYVHIGKLSSDKINTFHQQHVRNREWDKNDYNRDYALYNKVKPSPLNFGEYEYVFNDCDEVVMCVPGSFINANWNSTYPHEHEFINDLLKKNKIKLDTNNVVSDTIKNIFYGAAISALFGVGIKMLIYLIQYIIRHVRKECEPPDLMNSVKQFCVINGLEDRLTTIYDFINHHKNGTIVHSESWDPAQKFVKAKTIKATRIYAESMDVNAQQIIENQILSRQGLITLFKDKRELAKLNCLIINKNIFLFPKHLLPVGWKDNEYEVRVVLPTENTRMCCFHSYVNKKNVSQVNEDAMLIDFNSGTEWVKDITKHFITEADMIKFSNKFDLYQGCLVVNRKKLQQINLGFSPNVETVDYYARNDEYTILRGFNYNAMTQPGDCGAILVRFDDQEPRKMLGMHVAGSSIDNSSYAILITQEQLVSAIKRLNVGITVVAEFNLSDIDDADKCKVDGNILCLGKVDNAYSLYQPIKTEIVPSVIYGCFDVTKQPAALSSKDKRLKVQFDRTLIENQIMKFCICPRSFSPAVINEVRKWCYQFIGEMNYKSYERRLLTNYEILNGLIALEHINPNSSAGVPLVKNINEKGKRDFMVYIPDYGWKYTLKGEAVLLQVEHYELKAKERIRVGQVWSALLKDELRTLDKIEQGKTRAFVGCPFSFTILFRKYFGAFINFLHIEGLKKGFTTGINPESDDWNKLISRLLNNSSNFLAYDIKDFDARVIWQLMELFLDIVNSFYDDDAESRNVRACLMHEVCYTFMVISDVLYMKMCGVPSGLPMTVELDSWVSLFYMMISFIELHTENFGYVPSYELFRDNVALAINGDDNSSTVRLRVGTWYNNISIAKHLNDYDIVVTSAQKKDELVKFVDISEVEFLKRKVGKINEKYVPLMRLETIQNMVMWIRQPISAVDSTMVNIDNAGMFLFFYGEKVFNEYRDIFIKALHNKQIDVWPKSFSYYYSLYNRVGKFEINDSYDCIDFVKLNEYYYVDVGNEGEGKVIRKFNNKTNVKAEMMKIEGMTDCCDVKEVASDIKIVGDHDGMSLRQQAPCAYVMQEEVNMDIERLAKMPVKLAYGGWTISNGAGTNLFFMSLPSFLSAVPKYANYLQNFKYCRFKTRIIAEVNGSPFCLGKCILSLQPYRGLLNNNEFANTGQRNVIAPELVNASVYAHINNQCAIEIPWLGEYNYYLLGSTTNQFNDFANVALTVFTPLNVGPSSATSISWTIYIELFDLEAKILQPQNSAQFLNFTSINNNLTNAHNNALPMDVAHDQLDLDMTLPFPMDAVANTLAPMAMMRRITSNYNNVDGIFPNNRFDLHPRSLAVTRKCDFGFDYDEMSFEFFSDRWSWVGGTVINSSYANGNLVYSDLITPMDNELLNQAIPNGRSGDTLITSSNCSIITIPGMLSLTNRVWKGEIEFAVEFVASAYQTAKFFIAWQYGASVLPTTITTSTIDPMSGNGIIFEMNKGSNMLVVKIPFRHCVEWCNCVNNTSYSTTSAQYTPQCHFIGVFGIYVVNGLVSPSASPNTVTMNLYKKIGKNFKWGNCNPASSIANVIYAEKDTYEYIYPIVSLRNVLKRKVFWTNVLLTTSLPNVVFFDVISEFAKCYAQYFAMYRAYKGSIRLSFVLDSPLTPGENVYIYWFPYQNSEYNPNSTTTGSSQAWQMYDFIQSLHNTTNQNITLSATPDNLYGVPTSIWKISRSGPYRANTASVPAHVGGSATITAFNSSEILIPVCTEILSSQSMSVDIEIPYMNNTPISVLKAGVAGTILMYSATTTQVRVYMGAGDDFRLGQFIGVPQMSIGGYTTVGSAGNTGAYAVGMNPQDT